MKNRSLGNRLSNFSEVLEKIKSLISSTGVHRYDIGKLFTLAGDVASNIEDDLFAIDDAIAEIERLENIIEERDKRIAQLDGDIDELLVAVVAT